MPRYRILVIASISLLYLLASATRRDVLIYDEGIVVYAAERILNGEIPYRDFWGIYPPGQFYTLALAFKLFGTSLLVERIWEATIRLFLCLVIYQLTAKLTSPPIALTTWLLSVPVLGATGFYGYPMFTALVLSLFSALCFLNFLSKRRHLWLVLCGLSTGLTALYRHDVGFYTLAAEVIVLGAFFYHSSRNLSSTQRQGSFLHSFLLYIAATALPVGLITAYLLGVVPIRDLWESLFVFPATVFPAMRSLPYPPLIPDLGQLDFKRWLSFYLPLLVYLGSCAKAWSLFRRPERPGSEGDPLWGIILFTLLGMGLFAQSLNRADSIHMLPTSFPAFVLLMTLLSPSITGWIEPRRQTARTVGLGLFLAVLPFLFMQVREWSIQSSFYLPFECPSPLERAGCIPVSKEQELAVQFIQAAVPEGSPIFVGLSRHDRIFINDIVFYFLSKRPSATKYHYLHPGSATTLPVQERIIDDIQRSGVQYIVLFGGTEHVVEPNESGISSGVHALDAFIQQNYSEDRQFGAYSIWNKKEGL